VLDTLPKLSVTSAVIVCTPSVSVSVMLPPGLPAKGPPSIFEYQLILALRLPSSGSDADPVSVTLAALSYFVPVEGEVMDIVGDWLIT